MAAAPLFQLPDEAALAPVLRAFPGRERQIRSLATLLHPEAIACRNVVLHGTEATGKSAASAALLSALRLRHAVISSAQCITGRHLFESIVAAVAAAVGRGGPRRHCETLAQLAVELADMLRAPDRAASFVLVLDAVDRQRDALPTLLPALARLSEIVPCLTCVFIVTAPPSAFPRAPATPHIHFAPYTKQDLVRILSLSPPTPVSGTTQQETDELWKRFCAAVHDALVRPACRTLPALRLSCRALWPRFTAPVAAGTYAPRDFSKLLVAGRAHFQHESLLNPGIVSVRPTEQRPAAATAGGGSLASPASRPSAAGVHLTALLPTVARLLLLAAYLASHNAIRHDLTVFSTYHHGRRRRGGAHVGGRTHAARHRKIARKLLGANAFVLERALAIFEAVRREWSEDPRSAPWSVAGDAAVLDGDMGTAVATLASLRLLVRVGGGGDLMDRGGKWKVNAGWETIRGLGRSIGVEVDEWLME